MIIGARHLSEKELLTEDNGMLFFLFSISFFFTTNTTLGEKGSSSADRCVVFPVESQNGMNQKPPGNNTRCSKQTSPEINLEMETPT